MLHEHVVILSIETLPVPHVRADDRLVVDDLGYADDGITHVERPLRLHGRPRTSRRCCACSSRRELESPLDVDEASYFLSTIDLRRGDAPRHDAAGANGCSWPPRASPPTPPNTSASRASAR